MFTSIQETSWSKITRTSFISGTVLETLSGRNGAGCPAGPVPVNPSSVENRDAAAVISGHTGSFHFHDDSPLKDSFRIRF